MSKLFKGIAKGVKKIVKGIGKVFKKITSTTIGKIILAAALIWVGGLALGYFQGAAVGPFSSGGLLEGVVGSMKGVPLIGAGAGEAVVVGETIAAGGSGLVTGTGATAAADVGGVIAGTGGAGTLAVEGSGNIIAETMLANAPLAAAETVPFATGFTPSAALSNPATFSAAAPTSLATTAPTTAPSLLGKIVQGFSNLIPETEGGKLVAAAGLYGLSSAMSPDEMDILKEQEKIRNRRYRDAFGGVGDIDLGFRPAQWSGGNAPTSSRNVLQSFGRRG